jgi:hypothetical protein
MPAAESSSAVPAAHTAATSSAVSTAERQDRWRERNRGHERARDKVSKEPAAHLNFSTVEPERPKPV